MKTTILSFFSLVLLLSVFSIPETTAQIAPVSVSDIPIHLEEDVLQGPMTKITFDEPEFDFGKILKDLFQSITDILSNTFLIIIFD